MQAPWGLVLRCGPLAAAADHFFTASDLSLGRPSGEWEEVARFAGVAPGDLLLLDQVHGAGVAVASADRARPWSEPEADIVMTSDPDAAVAVRVADCVPILLADETGRAVAAVHAGWRGLVHRAPIVAVLTMGERYGIRPERLIAAVGPAIGPCCYEVGDEVRSAFSEAGHHARVLDGWFEPGPKGRLHLDTWRAAREQLEGTGVLPERIQMSGLCTLTHAETFHSYRARGREAGRMAAVIRPGAR